MRDELLKGKIFYGPCEAETLIEAWRRHYNLQTAFRPGLKAACPLVLASHGDPGQPPDPRPRHAVRARPGVDRAIYVPRAREVAALGCVCLAFDLRGHAATQDQRGTVTREDNIRDVVAAYDVLANHPAVDRSAIAVVGSSYGGYLAAVLTSIRPVRLLGLRVPALYKDDDWEIPKQELRRHGLEAFRQRMVTPEENRALAACAAFEGDVLIVRSERDETIPPPVIASYTAAFRKARSLTTRMIEGADHGLSEKRWQRAYTSLLVNWTTEMVLRTRESGAAPEVHADMAPSPRREKARPA